ncbi:MAG: DUF3052 family protein [Bacteroidota bacterium]
MATDLKTGYSGKPLYQKLGIKDDHKVLLIDEPDAYRDWLEIPFDMRTIDDSGLADFVHVFAKEKELLKTYITEAHKIIQQNGMIWVSWPKKASKVATDVNEDVVREIALPMGLVDVKVCSVSSVWSGLKLMIRKENRK